MGEQVCVYLLTAPLTMTTSNGNGKDGRCGTSILPQLSIIVLCAADGSRRAEYVDMNVCLYISDRNYLRRRKRSGL